MEGGTSNAAFAFPLASLEHDVRLAIVTFRLGPDDRDDVVQDALLRLLRRWPQVAAMTPDRQARYACGVARRAAVDLLRQRRRELPARDEVHDGVEESRVVADAGRGAGAVADVSGSCDPWGLRRGVEPRFAPAP